MSVLKIGRGTEEDVEVGPLIDTAAMEKVRSLVDDAVRGGARALLGGSPAETGSRFFPPTVLVDIPADARLRSEEIFGPVAPIMVFDTEDEAVAAANNTEYGLVSYLFTNDLSRALRVAERLESGMVGLNQGMVSNPAAPFGGVKHSGIGREGGRVGIDEYLEIKYIAMALS
jgi:succinate-semialdehyde dehydrogenase/glutarate-semialdehyde dehydrogenase